MTQAITSPLAAREFLLAGNATVTLRSVRTGVHYTYRIQRTDFHENRYFASLLTGRDNQSDYTYLGMVRDTGDRVFFGLTKKSTMLESSAPIVALCYALEHLDAGTIPPSLQIFHEGKCGRCGRALTVPESILRGIGPECATKLGGLHAAA